MGDLGDGRNRRVASPAGRPLLEGDARRHAGDLVHRGARELWQVLARVGGEGLEVAPLPLRVDDVESEGALAAAARPGHDDQLLARDREIHAPQIVLGRAHHRDRVGGAVDRAPATLLPCTLLPLCAQCLREEGGRRRPARLRHLLGRPGDDDAPALGAGPRTEIDHVIGAGRDAHVVLDDHHRVAPLDEPVEDREQRLHVVGVEASRGLVEEKEGPRRRGGEGFGELEPLRLAAAERVERLAQAQITEPHLLEGRELAQHQRVPFEAGGRLCHRQLENVGDVQLAVGHLEHLAREAPAAAFGTGERDVGEELHLHRLRALTSTGLTATPGDVERERPRGVAALLGEGLGAEALADDVPDLQVGRGIAAARTPEGGLIHLHHALEVLVTGDGAVAQRSRPFRVEGAADGGVERLQDQAALARAADARDTGEHPFGDLDVDALEVVSPRTLETDHAVARATLPALLRRAAERAARRGLCAAQLRRRPVEDDLAPPLTRPGAKLHHAVGRADHRLVVLDDDRHVVALAQPPHDRLEAPDVARVEPDGGLVEDEHGAGQRSAEGAREGDALGLAARERPRRAVEGEIPEADVDEHRQTPLDLVDEEARRGVAHLVPQRADRGEGLLHRQRVEVGEAATAEAKREGLLLEPRALAGFAGLVLAIAREEHPHVHLVGAALHPPKPAADAPPPLRVADLVPFDDPLPLRVGEGRDGDVGGDARLLRVLEELAALPGSRPALPRPDRTVGQAQRRVGDHLVHVHADGAAEAAARPAGTHGTVEREHPRRRTAEAPVAVGAAQVARESVDAGVAAHLSHRHLPVAVPHGRLDGLRESRSVRCARDQTVGDHLEGGGPGRGHGLRLRLGSAACGTATLLCRLLLRLLRRGRSALRLLLHRGLAEEIARPHLVEVDHRALAVR